MDRTSHGEAWSLDITVLSDSGPLLPLVLSVWAVHVCVCLGGGFERERDRVRERSIWVDQLEMPKELGTESDKYLQ